jgi:hypothetical protein
MALEAELVATVEAGRVELTFSVANVGTEPVTLRFDGDAAAEISVFADGERVWRWRDERAGEAGTPLADQTLSPGDTVVHRATWDDPLAGDYTAEARVAATNVDRSARATVSV